MTAKNFVWIARIVIASTFIFSAVAKLLSPGLFEITLIDQGVFSDRTAAAWTARFLIAVELTVGLLYLQKHYLKTAVSLLTGLMLSGFTVHLLYLAIKGDQQDCGCFGKLLAMSPVESIIKNIVLLALVYFVFRNTEVVKNSWKIPLAVLLISAVCVWTWAPIKVLNDFTFKQYTNFEERGRVDLAEGENLMCIFNLDCEHCQAAARELTEARKTAKIPETYILFFSEEGISVDSFFTIAGARYPYHMVSAEEFFSLIGNTPPRIYWLKEGRIEKYWDAGFTFHLRETFK
ncbi:hypothetical protein K1X84_15255 [bacterium]|nr:hypothetical protein [bacterium]